MPAAPTGVRLPAQRGRAGEHWAAGKGLCLVAAPWAVRDARMAGTDGGCSRGVRLAPGCWGTAGGCRVAQGCPAEPGLLLAAILSVWSQHCSMVPWGCACRQCSGSWVQGAGLMGSYRLLAPTAHTGRGRGRQQQGPHCSLPSSTRHQVVQHDVPHWRQLGAPG